MYNRLFYKDIMHALLLLVLAGCKQPQQSAVPLTLPPPDVVYATPLARDITDRDEYTGRLAAVKSVDIRSRVSGYLQSIHFREGAIVKEGDLLYIIDPRPYKAKYDQAVANLNKTMATRELAKNDLARAERLMQSHTIAEEVYDARSKQLNEADAVVEATRAAVSAAELDLEFTHIRAPINGRIGKTQVTEGNLVKGGDMESTLLTNIITLDPIYVYFTVDEKNMLRYLRNEKTGSSANIGGSAQPMWLRLSDEEEYQHEGRLDFIDNSFDNATGTMEVRGIFSNPDLMLQPGMFANVAMVGEGPYSALLIPDSAISMDQTLKYVFVVGPNNMALRKEIVTGRLLGGLRVIRSGLQPDDHVIITGIQKVVAGMPVNPKPGVIEEKEVKTPAL
jgi:RND family efflux transporter MFP subunit